MAEAVVESPPPGPSAVPGPTSSTTISNNRSPSPPPNCAICLGNCINKCFSDSCMHQFCFKCLLEWSKVKAVCPLCKQPFTSIIHNVKSNEEYDQHFVPLANPDERSYEDFYPINTINTSRHFQFRTTLTLDPRGELAIQQLLSTHSMTNSLPHYNTTLNVIRNPYFFRSRRIRDVSSSQYRRSIYERNLWTNPLEEITGRYRETTPMFYRENPAAKNRLVPFLQREMNALIPDDSLRAMNLVHRILAAVDDHPIRGRYLKQLLQPELGAHTTHFLYEFFTYARSTYDMYGYDRHSHLTNEAPSEHESSDSDILIVSVGRLESSEVIEINSESSHDSDVVIREPTPPVLVDLAGTTTSSDDSVCVEHIPAAHSPKLPAILRHKRSRMHMPKKRKRQHCPSSSSSDSSTSRHKSHTPSPVNYESSSSNDGSTSSIDELHRAIRDQKRKKLRNKRFLKMKKYAVSTSSSTTSSTSASTSTSTTMATTTSIKNEQSQSQEDSIDTPPSLMTDHLLSSVIPPLHFPDLYSAWEDRKVRFPGDDATVLQRGQDEPGPSGIGNDAMAMGNAWYSYLKPYSDSD